ncbi:hypothetical protein ACFCX0_03640 [Streptomyces sp. NPDC056352]|uniref:hypothetical protein n=1 Tax=Streptomyces sp. NPDC056352 TaxID=3345791 RepID=UPI0035DC9207
MDAVQLTSATAIADRPAPLPGRLLVDHDAGLGLGPALKPLADVPAGQTVTVTGRIDSLTVAGTRVLLLLADSDGDTATVIVPSPKFMAASRSIGRPITVGDTVQLHGTVSARFEHMPKIIDAFAFRAVAA